MLKGARDNHLRNTLAFFNILWSFTISALMLLVKSIFQLLKMMMNCLCGTVGLTKEKHLALFLARTIVRDPLHREFPRAWFEPAQDLSSGLVEWSCAVNITISPRGYDAVIAVSLQIKTLSLFVFLSAFKTTVTMRLHN